VAASSCSYPVKAFLLGFFWGESVHGSSQRHIVPSLVVAVRFSFRFPHDRDHRNSIPPGSYIERKLCRCQHRVAFVSCFFRRSSSVSASPLTRADRPFFSLRYALFPCIVGACVVSLKRRNVFWCTFLRRLSLLFACMLFRWEGNFSLYRPSESLGGFCCCLVSLSRAPLSSTISETPLWLLTLGRGRAPLLTPAFE